MMVVVCSKDLSLINLCIDLVEKKEVKAIKDFKRLKFRPSDRVELVIIDLQWCQEKDLPFFYLPTLALTPTPTYTQAVRLLQKGVRGYGNRYMLKENLNRAVNAVQAKQVWLPPKILNRMINSLSQDTPDRRKDKLKAMLSTKEKEVARYITHGLSNKDVAEKMCISVRTVKSHLTSIFAKTGFRGRLELAVNMKNILP